MTTTTTMATTTMAMIRYKHIASQLASYAIPQFVRLLPEMESTGTFKQRKVGIGYMVLGLGYRVGAHTDTA